MADLLDIKPGHKFGTRVVVGAAERVPYKATGRQKDRSVIKHRVACTACSSARLMTRYEIRNEKRCQCQVPNKGGTPGRTWRPYCRRCGVRGHYSKTCKRAKPRRSRRRRRTVVPVRVSYEV